MPTTNPDARTTSLRSNTSGATAVEYVVVLVLVSLGASLTVATMAVLLARYHAAQQAWLSLPFP
jgi:hypothetical protein